MSADCSIDLTEDEQQASKETGESVQFQFVDCSTPNPLIRLVSKLEAPKITPIKTSTSNVSVKKKLLPSSPSNQLVQKNTNGTNVVKKSVPNNINTLNEKINKKIIHINSQTNQGPTQNQILNDLLKSNSNIETVNLDSDSSDDESMLSGSQEQQPQQLSTSIKIHNNVIISPPQKANASVQPITKPSHGTIKKVFPNKNKPNYVKQINSVITSQNKVTSPNIRNVCLPIPTIPNSQVQGQQSNPKEINNRGTPIPAACAVNEPKKTYRIVIPPELLPVISRSNGPVLLNIPNIGPVILNSSLLKGQTQEHPTIKPFSLNFQDILNQHNQQVPKKQTQAISTEMVVKNKYDPLCDKKFSCWNLWRCRKRDLEGFTVTDRLGFYKNEIDKPKKCLRTLSNLIHIREKEIMKREEWKAKRHALKRKQEQLKIMKDIKFVEIDKIKQQHKFLEPPPLAPFRKIQGSQKIQFDINRTKLTPSRPVVAVDSDSGDDDNNLLVTKKVVVLNDNRKRRGKGLLLQSKYLLKQKRKNALLRKGIIGIKEPNTSKTTKNTKIGDIVVPRKVKQIDYEKRYNLKPCYVELKKNQQVERAFRKYTKEKKQLYNIVHIFNQRIISNVDAFRKEILPIKPLVILNENNFNIVKYRTEFSKYNIIYLVHKNQQFAKQLFKSEDFIGGVELGYIKLVDADVLCKYLAGGCQFRSGLKRNMEMEHSYSVL